MMSLFKKASDGFSLIELMVVLAIISVLMMLSGGLMQNSINKQGLHVELEKVSQLFKQLSYKAYYTGTSFQVRLEENNVYISTNQLNEFGDTLPEEVIHFNQIIFVATSYFVSTQGVVSPETVSIFQNQQIKTFPVKYSFSNHYSHNEY